ncbi:hypothetical protein GYMLUDRAFT_245666 [Collybiopsis luxurians FD-317 M1]|uniref:Uncharacterized protein n=1 Tax=Collybiopsis luxurians FD-317 M1 TaxID=944289 RepID=A0A0D0CKC3_9AGAR|nr:hypothetical protein GYMLUDRAFT_245666 [Collybiopsis luxurians FD-317 M1]
MLSSQAFSDQPITSSSASGGSQPQLIIKILQSLQSASMVPFSNALPSAPPAAKKMRRVAFECSTCLSYPLISIMDCIPPSLPTGLQPIYEDTYLANLSPKVLDRGKEVICDTADVNVEMGAPEELDAMTLDYPEDVPPPPVPVLTPSAPVWKASNNWSYRKVSSLKTWFFEPLIKQVPSNGSSLTRDEMIQTAVEHVVTRMASLFAGPRKKMLEQDLWALVDGMIQGAFADLEEQLQHSPSEPPAPFSSKSLLRFIESLTVMNMTSANILDCLETENLHLKEQVSLRESQLEEKDEELARLKSFVRHFKGDVQSSEVQQLRAALEAQDGKIEELKKKLAASEEAH